MASIEELSRVDLTSSSGSATLALKDPTLQTNPTDPVPNKKKPTRPPKKPKEPKQVKQPDPAREVPQDEKPKQNPTNPANPTIPKVDRTVKPKGNGDPTIIDPSSLQPDGGSTIAGTVAALPNKFALIVGNSEGKMTAVPAPDFATNDAMMLRETLVANSGYSPENIDLIQNATAAQILSAAKALADRLPEGGTILIFFAGSGVNIDGKDYLAGVDTEAATDSASMLSKEDLFRLFMAKGANIFSFFEVNRPVIEGRYFGMEVPMVGSIAQVQATIPGANCYGLMRGGKMVGVFGSSLVGVLDEFRTNRVPILEFSWQVFYRMRRGSTGKEGGGSQQTPTLPMLTNIASDAKF
jgi:hypothetical protein